MQAETELELWEHQPITLLPIYVSQLSWLTCIAVFCVYGEPNWVVGLMIVTLMITSQMQALRLSNINSNYHALSTRISNCDISRKFTYAVTCTEDVKVLLAEIESVEADKLSPCGASFLITTRTDKELFFLPDNDSALKFALKLMQAVPGKCKEFGAILESHY